MLRARHAVAARWNQLYRPGGQVENRRETMRNSGRNFGLRLPVGLLDFRRCLSRASG